MAIEVKICGLNSPAAVGAAVTAGADYVGFVFCPASPRAISPQTGAELGRLVPKHVRKVALVVDAKDEMIADIVKTVQPDMLQLHGDESPPRVSDIRARFALPVIKALPIAFPADVETAGIYEDTADYLLFDARAPEYGLPGGNANAFDWILLADAHFSKPWFLAGGLNPDNVARAIEISGTARVDVSSGVEITRGEKSPELIQAFIRAAKGTDKREPLA
jgi:phosphoribosylanthranilate isomerase